MQAIEFEAVANQRTLRLPDNVPDGAKLRVLLLMEEDVFPSRPEQGDQVNRRHPSPKLAGSVIMKDDLIAPAVAPEEWELLR